MTADSKLKKQRPDFISTNFKIDQRIEKEQQRLESILEFKGDLHNPSQLPVQKEIISQLIPLVRLIAINLPNMFFINHLNQLS